jgi:hypothetical protein
MSVTITYHPEGTLMTIAISDRMQHRLRVIKRRDDSVGHNGDADTIEAMLAQATRPYISPQDPTKVLANLVRYGSVQLNRNTGEIHTPVLAGKLQPA